MDVKTVTSRMDIKKSQLNAKAILADLDWLHKVIQCRFQLYWNQESPYQSIHEIQPPDNSLSSDLTSILSQLNILSCHLCLLLLGVDGSG